MKAHRLCVVQVYEQGWASSSDNFGSKIVDVLSFIIFTNVLQIIYVLIFFLLLVHVCPMTIKPDNYRSVIAVLSHKSDSVRASQKN